MSVKSRAWGLFGVVLCLSLGTAVTASPATVQFSADTYQKGPQGELSGKIFVGDGVVRTDMAQGGQSFVQIVDTARQTTWIIYPDQKSYSQLSGGGPAATNVDAKPGDRNPCQGMEGAKCSRLGEELVNGRSAVKWLVEFSWQGKSYTGTQWIDKERGLALKSDSGSGQISEQRLIGMEQVGGRQTEKWQTTVVRSNQPAQESYRWFDPELNLAIREEVPGKYLQEMRNIRVGPQDPSLFQVPAGYKQVAPPANQPPRR